MIKSYLWLANLSKKSGDSSFTKYHLNGLRTNIFLFYLRSWLILSIAISQPSFDHRLTLTIYLTTSVWVNQYQRNREFGSIYSAKFHDAFHVSKIPTKTSCCYIRSKSLITLYSTQRTRCFLMILLLKIPPSRIIPCEPRSVPSGQETVRNPRRPWRSRICVVSQLVSDHSPSCGLHLVCLWFLHSKLGHGAYPSKNYISKIVLRGFFL